MESVSEMKDEAKTKEKGQKRKSGCTQAPCRDVRVICARMLYGKRNVQVCEVVWPAGSAGKGPKG